MEKFKATNDVKFVSASHFNLAPEELERMYALLALFSYRFDRQPGYDQQKILRRFKGVIEEFNLEIIRLLEREPNNHTLNQIHIFFKLHCGSIRDVVKSHNRLSL